MRTLLPGICAAALAAAIMASGCSRPDSREENRGGVPLPKAWPRTALYDTIHAPAADGSDIMVNAAATTTPATGGFTVAYPRYRATLYISDSRASSDAEARSIEANRRERISLNAGGQRTEIAEAVTANGFRLSIFTTPAGSLTPLQFIATGGQRIVSGTMVMDRIPVSADSVAPTLRAVTDDILHLATHLAPQ